jgi:TetR/AcrR family transcriptional regulator, cholesterol catabolism regulator
VVSKNSNGHSLQDSHTSNTLRPRRRILDAALELVTAGGYDALQVRALTEHAGVSSRTIYENFASLDSLLIVPAAEHSSVHYRRLIESQPAGHTAVDRVNQLVDELTTTMTSHRPLTVALLRALYSGKPDVGPHVQRFRDVFKAMLLSAITTEHANAADPEIAGILESIWFTALAGWATGADSDARVGEIMRSATQLLLPGG